MWRAWLLLGLWTLDGSASVLAAGDVLHLDGVTFAAEHGGLHLVDGWGRGTSDDPFVVVEEIHGDGAAILTVRDVRRHFDEPARIGIGTGFVLVKVVTNRTRRSWASFEMELRERLEVPSGYFDGLSFAQARDRRAGTGSDRFTDIVLYDEPTDRAVFQGATIEPGETVRVQVTITDHSPVAEFFLIQRRDAPLATLVPVPR